MQPTKETKERHNGIKAMLQVLGNISGQLESGKAVGAGHLDMIVDFIQIYIDSGPHHGKEELLLFPALEHVGRQGKESGIIEELLAEHTVERAMSSSSSRIVMIQKVGPKASLK